METDKLLSKDNKLAKTLHDIFSKVVKNLDTSAYNVDDTFHENIGHTHTLKFILKYRRKPQVIIILEFFNQMKSLVQ